MRYQVPKPKNGIPALRALLDTGLNKEDADLVESVREFSRRHLTWDEIKPMWEAKRMHESVWSGLFEQGFMELSVPEGRTETSINLSLQTQGRIVRELSYGDPSTCVVACVHNSLCLWPIVHCASEVQGDGVLKALTDGSTLGAFQLSESDNASNPGALQCRAVRDGDAYVINGSKAWITNCGEKDADGNPFPWIAILFARTSDEGNRGISAFLVHSDTEGVRVHQKEDKLGLPSSATNQIHYTNARIPAANLVGEEGDGFKIAMCTLNMGRIYIAFQALGLAHRCIEELIKESTSRNIQTGKLSENGIFKGKFAHLVTEFIAAHSLAMQACKLHDEGENFAVIGSMAKNAATQCAADAATEAMQSFGAMGQMCDLPFSRLLLSARIIDVYEGAREVHQSAIASNLLR